MRHGAGRPARSRRRIRIRHIAGRAPGIPAAELGLAVAAALAVIGVIIAAATGTFGAQGPAVTDPARSASHASGSPGPLQSPASELVPTAGAYLGAYVQPRLYNSAGEIAAVNSFQQQTGRQLQLVHVYRRWGYPFPTASDRYFAAHGKILLVTWSGRLDTRQIISGKDDAQIRARAEAIENLGYPILLEFRHEMDRPNLQGSVHGPKDYIAAWDHIRAIFAQVGANNVGWVWCPTGYGFATGRAQRFYPGNSEVDWVCADIYSPSPSVTLGEEATPFLEWAAHTHKPILIGEFGVGGNPAGWPGWLANAGRLPLQYPQIKGMAYYDGAGYDSQHQAFDYRLSDNPLTYKALASLMAAPWFQPRIPAGI